MPITRRSDRAYVRGKGALIPVSINPPKTYRIVTHAKPPVVYLYTDRQRAQRKVRTLQRQGVEFDLSDNATETPIAIADLD